MKTFPLLDKTNYIVQHNLKGKASRTLVLTKVASTGQSSTPVVKPGTDQSTLNMAHLQIIAKNPTGYPGVEVV